MEKKLMSARNATETMSKRIISCNYLKIRKTICTLDEALEYQNEEIIHRFLQIYDMSFAEAGDIFIQTKKWLWLLAVAHQDENMGKKVPRLTIDKSLLSIDEMWHNFILFTQEYGKYCISKFGFYIHHKPNFAGKNQEEQTLLSLVDHRRNQYSYTYDVLGSDTLELWYETMCDKYTFQYFNRIRKM
jgi:hypothetical protein